MAGMRMGRSISWEANNLVSLDVVTSQLQQPKDWVSSKYINLLLSTVPTILLSYPQEAGHVGTVGV